MSSPKMGSSISRTVSVPSLSVHAKAREQSVKTVLNAVPSLSNCSKSHTLTKRSANETDVSIGKGSSADRHSPVSGAARTPSKPVPTRTCNISVVKPKVLKPSSETAMLISWPSPSFSVHAKVKEQSLKTALRREYPRGNSLMDTSNCVVRDPISSSCVDVRAVKKPSAMKEEIELGRRTRTDESSPVYKAARRLPSSTPNTRAASVLAPSTCPVVRAPRKMPNKKGKVSMEERASAVKHLPLSNTAVMLHKPTSASVIRNLPALPSSRAIPMQQTLNDVKAHMKILLQAAVPLFDKIPSANDKERSDERIGLQK